MSLSEYRLLELSVAVTTETDIRASPSPFCSASSLRSPIPFHPQMRFFAAPASVSHIFPVSNFPLLNPFVFNLARLAVSSLMALLVLFCYPEPPSPRLVAAGAELGFWTLLVNVCVVAALARTAAPRVGFLAQLQTIIVPLASLLCIRGPAAADPSGAAPEASSAGPPSASRPELRTLPFSLLALAGSALLALEKPGALAAGIGVSTGEGLAVLSAVFGTVYVLRSQYLSRRLPPVPLTAVKTISQASCAAIQISISHSYVFRDMSVPALQSLIAGTTLPALALNIGLVLYAGVGVSFLGAVLQISAIRHVAASDAALIFAFSPVVTAVLAALLMREVLGPRSAIGAALILTACVATAVSGARERRKERLED